MTDPDRTVPGTYVLDLDSLCGFAAYVASKTLDAVGIVDERQHEHWHAVSAAVTSWIDTTLDRIAFAEEAAAAIDGLPTTEDAALNQPEFGKAAPTPFGFDPTL